MATSKVISVEVNTSLGDVKSRVYAYVTRAHEVKCPLWNSLNLDERFNQAKNVNNAAWTLSLYTRALKQMEISW